MPEQVRTILESNPESFSANVVLRPVCQDYLLPTAAYVAGPGEIAYFAQLKGVYEHFGVEMPPLFPRASATIVEHRISRLMEKYQLTLLDAFSDFETVMKKAFAAAGLAADGVTTIRNAEWAQISFPEFYDILEGLVVRDRKTSAAK